MRIIISGGHFDNPQTPWIEDSGATYGTFTEYQICQNIRNEVLKLLPSAIPVPSNMPLASKIAFINSFCKPDDLCIEIHLNSNANVSKRCCEAYYSDSPYLADIFSRNVSASLGVPNGGSKHDTETYVGSLGWLRQIKAQSVLIEAAYLSNPEDRMKLVFPSGQQAVARGIINGINEHLGNLSTLEKLKGIIKSLMQLINGTKI